MASYATRNNSERTRSSSSSNNNNNYENEKGVKVILPETSIPTFAAQVPELKKFTSYWQIGTASLSRVKINALRPDVKIRTDRATTITGMFSEFYGPVETLGTTIVHIFNAPMEIHVTRSNQCAPIVADGILGSDFLSEHSISLALGNPGRLFLRNHRDAITVVPAKDLINNYTTLIRRKVIESSVARERGNWSIVSKDLRELRDCLPISVHDDDRLPIIETLDEYADCFHLPGEKLGVTTLTRYSIKMRDNEIVCKPQYKLTNEMWNKIERQVDYLLDQGIIEPSSSPWNSTVSIIEKKPNSRGEVYHRLAVDYRELNNRSLPDGFLIPDIIDLCDQLNGSKFFTVLDLASASYQISLHPRDREKTAFTTRTGRYEFTRMPGGIKNASQKLQRLLHTVLDGMICPCKVFVCYDDILIHAPTMAELEIRVREVLSRMRNANLKVQPDKCQLFRKSVNYLGYRITDEGLKPDPVKIERLKMQELPMSHHELSSFFGLLSSFKRFVPNFATRSRPIAKLLKNVDFEWTEEAVRSFDDFMDILHDDWCLRYPDWNREFILEMRTSDFGVDVGLMQRGADDKSAGPIAYASKRWTALEQMENRCNKELLAAIYGIDTWYWYFCETDGKQIVLRTSMPEAFDRYRLRHDRGSEVPERFEEAFIGRDFVVEML